MPDNNHARRKSGNTSYGTGHLTSKRAQAIRHPLKRPSKKAIDLAVEAVSTRRIPAGLRDAGPAKVFLSVAYVIFGQKIWDAGGNVGQVEEATLAQYHASAWREAKVLLIENGMTLPGWGSNPH